MAKIVFLREGSGSDRLINRHETTVSSVLAHIGNRVPKYIGAQPPTIPTDRPDLTSVRNPAYVLVSIASTETEGALDKPGYYLLENVTPAEADKWI